MGSLTIHLLVFIFAVPLLADVIVARFGFTEKVRHVRITNMIAPGVDLTFDCKSKDDDLGKNVLHYNNYWEFQFRPNIWSSTRFYCGWSWQNEFHWFDIYANNRDYRLGLELQWMIHPTGPCMRDQETKKFDICYPWNKPADH